MTFWKTPISADSLINKMGLKPHPHGCGYFIETDRDKNLVQLEKGGEKIQRNLSTSIIALFKSNQKNPLHRTCSTQIIHLYPGGNSELLVHCIENGGIKSYCMPKDKIQLKITPMTWFALEVKNKNKDAFVITGHTVTPGFDINDLELAERYSLTKEYPSLVDFIKKFTNDDAFAQSCSIKSRL